MTKKILVLIILLLFWSTPMATGSQETPPNGLIIHYDIAYDKLHTTSTVLRTALEGTNTVVTDGSLDNIPSDTDIVFATGTLGIGEDTLSSVKDWFTSGDKRIIVVSVASDLYHSDYNTTVDSQLLINTLGNNYTTFHDQRYIQDWLFINEDNTTSTQNERHNSTAYNEHAVSDREYNQYVSYQREPIFNFTNEAYDDLYTFTYPDLLSVRHVDEFEDQTPDSSYYMIPHDNPYFGLILMMGKRDSYAADFGSVSINYRADDLQKIYWRPLMTIQEITEDHFIITLASPTQYAEHYSPVWNGIFNWFNEINSDEFTSENPTLNDENSSESSLTLLPFTINYLMFIPIVLLYKKKIN